MADDPSTTESAVRREPEYVGFWKRLFAFVIDCLVIVAVVVPLLLAIYGGAYFSLARTGYAGIWDFLIQVVFPAIAAILFWRYRGATPGKMLISAKIVDAKTFGPPSTGKLIGRYFAYIVSSVLFCLGFLWIAIDKRKQGWHDKLAGTVVIRAEDD